MCQSLLSGKLTFEDMWLSLQDYFDRLGHSPVVCPCCRVLSTDQFYGDRNAGVNEPFGNHWWIARHKEDLSPEEYAKGEEDFMNQYQRQQQK
jgi:hypothetical protein